jgi:5-methylcytosine-specific restriction endonuclease McrA
MYSPSAENLKPQAKPRLPLLKKCGACKRKKPRSEFTKNKTKPDGLGYYCKPCHRKKDKKYRARRTPEFKRLRWERERTPQKRLRDQIGRHRRLHGGDLTVQEWLDLLERYGHTCLRCEKHESETPEGALTIDHVVPCPDGPNSIDNIQPLCLSCNVKKGIKHTDYRTDALLLPRKAPGVATEARREALAS